jgi:hypothetical protein
MRVTDDDGRLLDAEYRIERDGGSLALILRVAAVEPEGDQPGTGTIDMLWQSYLLGFAI